MLAPATTAALADAVRAARAAKTPLAVAGAGTRAGLGRPVQAAATLSTRALAGITLYEPAELVIGARAGTPLAELEATLAAKGQMLPFEPMDHRALYGTAGEPTVGGVVATNASGPRRLSAGACRDSMIGVVLVNGRGEEVKSGGRVMKNVTGYDLVKLMAGSHGTLGVLAEVVFKVLPRPERVATLEWRGLDDARAVALLTAATASPYEVAAAAHLPARGGEPARTLLRLENFARSIDYRAGELRKLFAGYGPAELREDEEISRLWTALRDGAVVAGEAAAAVWRVSTAPTRGPAVVDAIRAAREVAVAYDWAGGLVWLATSAEGDAGAAAIRAAVARHGGHATLLRAPDAVRAALDVFEPPAPAVRALSHKLKASFDPDGILNPGRMHVGI